MSNNALYQKLYDLGHQLYLQEFNKINSSVKYGREPIDEDHYNAMPLQQLTQLAEENDPAAQFCLGAYYADNNRMRTAFDWFQRSAKNGCADAMETLGAIYTQGMDGCPSDRKKALEWLTKAAKNGCTAFTVSLILDYYLEQDHILYTDYLSAYPWAMYYATLMRDSEENASSVLRVISLFQLLITVELRVASERPQESDYPKAEMYALLCFFWQGLAYDFGITQTHPDAVVKDSEILCQIGECAYKMRKPYGKETLEEAMEQGSDYAAVLLVPEAIDRAWNVKTTPAGPTLYTVIDHQILARNSIGPHQINAANSCVEAYFPRVRRAASDSSVPYRQAEALYRLAQFYLFGLYCKRDHTTAHKYLEQAAQLGHSASKGLLTRARKKFPFGWEFQ